MQPAGFIPESSPRHGACFQTGCVSRHHSHQGPPGDGVRSQSHAVLVHAPNDWCQYWRPERMGLFFATNDCSIVSFMNANSFLLLCPLDLCCFFYRKTLSVFALTNRYFIVSRFCSMIPCNEKMKPAASDYSIELKTIPKHQDYR